MKRSFGLNYVFHMLYQLVVLALPLLTTPYLSRVLGAGEIGRYSFAGSIASYFVLLATLGTTLYGQRLIARVQHQPKVRTHFFVELQLLRSITAVLSAGALVSAGAAAALVSAGAADAAVPEFVLFPQPVSENARPSASAPSSMVFVQCFMFISFPSFLLLHRIRR